MIYTGYHAIEEAIISSDEKVAGSMQLFYSKTDGRVKDILSVANKKGIVCSRVSEKALDSKVGASGYSTSKVRGVLLCAGSKTVSKKNDIDFNEWLLNLKEKQCTVLILDSITDPHNVGAILRSCDQFGVTLVLLTQRRSIKDVKESDVISRTSSGAASWVSISVVKNLSQSIRLLKEAGFWIYGADMTGDTLYKTSFADRSAIIVGSEGSGISKLLKTQCDIMTAIPTCGKIDSLNVSVATGIILYEVYRQRSKL